MKKSYTPS